MDEKQKEDFKRRVEFFKGLGLVPMEAISAAQAVIGDF